MSDPTRTDCYAELEEYARLNPWTAEDAAFWTGTPTYQPWKDVAAFFKGTAPDLQLARFTSANGC